MIKRYVLLVLGLVALAILLIVVNPEFWKAARGAYDPSFLKGYEKGLMRNCLNGDSSEQKLTYCECVKSEVLSKLTVRQLHDFAFTKEYADKNIIPLCLNKAGIPGAQGQAE